MHATHAARLVEHGLHLPLHDGGVDVAPEKVPAAPATRRRDAQAIVDCASATEARRCDGGAEHSCAWPEAASHVLLSELEVRAPAESPPRPRRSIAKSLPPLTRDFQAYERKELVVWDPPCLRVRGSPISWYSRVPACLRMEVLCHTRHLSGDFAKGFSPSPSPRAPNSRTRPHAKAHRGPRSAHAAPRATHQIGGW